MSMNSVPIEARDIIERAIQADAFKPKAKTSSGAEILLVQTPADDWLAIVEVTDAIIIRSVRKVSNGQTLDEQVAALAI